MVAKSPAVQRKNASAAKRNITRTVSSVANSLGPKETMNVAGKFSKSGKKRTVHEVNDPQSGRFPN